ncbi:MAG: hypothetical protein WCP35_07925 [Verrucomicrobiota bacterium]
MNESIIEPKWAGVVHARTYAADFCLAVPEGTSEAERKWLQEVCSASSRSAGDIDVCKGVFVACRSNTLTLAGILVESTFCTDVNQYHRDKWGRSFNVFLGFVTRDSISQLPTMNIETFRPLYEFVINRWNIDLYAPCESALIESSHAEIGPDSVLCDDMNLNLDTGIQSLFPFSEKEILWRQFSKVEDQCSLIVGVKSIKADRFFMNAVCSDCGIREDRPHKISERIVKKPDPIPEGSNTPKRPPENKPLDNKRIGTHDIFAQGKKFLSKAAGNFLGSQRKGTYASDSIRNKSQLCDELDSIIQDFKSSVLEREGQECLNRLVCFRDKLRGRI